RTAERAELESFFEVARKMEALQKRKREMAEAAKADPGAANSAGAEDDDDSSDGDNVPPHGATPLRATSWGEIRSVHCDGLGINFVLEDSKLTVQLHSSDYTKIKYDFPPDLAGTQFKPCEQLEGKSAAINYTVRGNVMFRGEIVSIQIRNRATSGSEPIPSDRHIRSRPPAASAESHADPVAVKMMTTGKIGEVTCDENELLMTLTAGTKSLGLHSRNYRNIEFYSMNWTAPDNFNPCTQLKGLTAKIQYSVVPGKAYAGEIITLEVDGEK
ncbi:MAG: hypothetical protein ACRD4K_15685, partial [Candidatus Acidiferrales bacterium]